MLPVYMIGPGEIALALLPSPTSHHPSPKNLPY
jgi:hypothetical protein